MKKVDYISLIIGISITLIMGCSNSGSNTSGDTDTNTGTGNDTTTNSESDSGDDTQTDISKDSETDTNTDSNSDSETETGTDTSSENDTDSGTDTVVAEYPSDLMRNYNQWKITYPDGVEDKTLFEETNEYFHLNDAKDAIVFYVPIRDNNGSTKNSDYIRSELRERTADGKNDIYWTTTGTHVVYCKQAITHLPINKPELVATQIHGNKADGIDDAMVLRLEDKHLFLSFNGGDLRSDITISTNYQLGTVHEVIFKIVDGKHYCYYSEDGNLQAAFNNNTAEQYLIKDGANDYVMDLDYDETYFKIGNYTQSNPDKEGSDTGDPDNYGEVWVYDFRVSHS